MCWSTEPEEQQNVWLSKYGLDCKPAHMWFCWKQTLKEHNATTVTTVLAEWNNATVLFLEFKYFIIDNLYHNGIIMWSDTIFTCKKHFQVYLVSIRPVVVLNDLTQRLGNIVFNMGITMHIFTSSLLKGIQTVDSVCCEESKTRSERSLNSSWILPCGQQASRWPCLQYMYLKLQYAT